MSDSVVTLRPDYDPGDPLWFSPLGACLGLDPELFFPQRGENTREAKAVCVACAVRSPCLEYAIRHGEKFGIWGGLSERERRRIRRQRALAEAEAAAERRDERLVRTISVFITGVPREDHYSARNG